MAGVLFPSLWRWFLEALRWPSETVHAGSASGGFIILNHCVLSRCQKSIMDRRQRLNLLILNNIDRRDDLSRFRLALA